MNEMFIICMVTLKELKLSARDKIPTRLIYAAAIAGTPDQHLPEVQSFLDRMQRVPATHTLEELALDYKANDPVLIIERSFTEVEEETYRQWVEVHDRHEGKPDSPAPKSILAARQAALNSGCAGAAPHENGGRCCCRCYSSWVVRHHGATCLDYSTQWPGVQPQAALSF